MIRVAIVEDEREIREGLSLLIGGTAGLAVIGAYPSMETAIPALLQDPPQIALVDIGSAWNVWH